MVFRDIRLWDNAENLSLLLLLLFFSIPFFHVEK